jgi:hypothetical protein
MYRTVIWINMNMMDPLMLDGFGFFTLPEVREPWLIHLPRPCEHMCGCPCRLITLGMSKCPSITVAISMWSILFHSGDDAASVL